ncbi:hypothetical protein ACFL35_04345 [Candidatus Riflebacteria bacterium]
MCAEKEVNYQMDDAEVLKIETTDKSAVKKLGDEIAELERILAACQTSSFPVLAGISGFFLFCILLATIFLTGETNFEAALFFFICLFGFMFAIPGLYQIKYLMDRKRLARRIGRELQRKKEELKKAMAEE